MKPRCVRAKVECKSAGVCMSQFQSLSRTFVPFERIPLLPEEWTGWRDAIATTMKRLIIRMTGLALIVAAIGTTIAFATYTSSDPSWNNSSGAVIQNALGPWGANIADLLFQSIGITGWIAAIPPLLWGIWLVDGRVGLKLVSRIASWMAANRCASDPARKCPSGPAA